MMRTKRTTAFVLMLALTGIMVTTLSVTGLPFWAYILGIFIPIAIWALVKPHKAFDGTKFLEED